MKVFACAESWYDIQPEEGEDSKELIETLPREHVSDVELRLRRVSTALPRPRLYDSCSYAQAHAEVHPHSQAQLQTPAHRNTGAHRREQHSRYRQRPTLL